MSKSGRPTHSEPVFFAFIHHFFITAISAFFWLIVDERALFVYNAHRRIRDLTASLSCAWRTTGGKPQVE